MADNNAASPAPQLNKLVKNITVEIRRFAESKTQQIQRLSQIGIALSAEKNITKLLEMIVSEAMDFTHADAGTLYIVDEKASCLKFQILKNRTLKTHIGGTSGVSIDLPPVPLMIEGKPNQQNVSSYAALTGEIVNIPDVYKAEGFDFTGPKKYDKQTGYYSKSMLVVPMKNHRNDIIGVLQLLNAQDSKTHRVIPFAENYVDLTASLASQAAVALENAQLIYDLKQLFEAFIESIATAIDEKSPYTAGHIRRVTELTMMIAEVVNQSKQAPFDKISLSDDEMEELRIATWMHDIGKITTPEHVVDKSAKLETVFDRITLIKTRFQLIRELTEKAFLQKKVALLEQGKPVSSMEKLATDTEKALIDLDEEAAFIIDCNTGRQQMSDADVERLKAIAAKEYDLNGEKSRYLTENEVYNLTIRRGTLTAEEREIIQNHALISYKMLKQLPFPKNMARVPEYAGGHHEKLDGSGYPFGLKGEALPLQARMMAIADIFEALTAKDRPYKTPMKLSTAMRILANMCDENHIDRDVYQLLVQSGVFLRYAEKELNKEQIDVSE